ncbi:MAG: VWA domain-containing protein [Kiritimatiellales bacterium]
MSFSWPWILLLLPLALLFLRRRNLNAIEVSSLSGWRGTAQPRRVKWLSALRILNAIACALLIIAMAGPRVEKSISEETHQGIAIEMLVDISSSMDRNITGKSGEKTTRMEAAKKTVEQFIENRPDDLIGLITFARYADTLSPLTFGHSALIQLTRDIQIQDRPNEDGTAYGDALALACAHLDRMNDWSKEKDHPAAQIESKTVILLTDGENNCGLHLPQEAAALAAKWNIRLYAISLGDSGETSKELTDSEQLLQTISEATGGSFWKIYDLDSLNDAYETIDQLEKSEIKNTTTIRTEYRGIFTLFALPALILLITAQLLSATVLRITEEVEA